MLTYAATLEAVRIAKESRSTTGSLHALAADVEAHLYGRQCSIYQPEYFKAWELVPPDVLKRFGDKALMFVNTRVIWTLDAMRQYFDKPVVVNTYRSGKLKTLIGDFDERGLRTPATATGAAFSPHKRGDAADLNIMGIGVDEVRDEILSHQNHPAFRFITRIEGVVTGWLHFDVVNTGSSQIHVFNP